MQHLNPEVLRWARETASLTHSQAAKKLNLSASKGLAPEDRLIEIEEGRIQPEPPMLEKMAKYYHRPLITFYLEKPPRTSDYGVDYRRTSNEISPIQDSYLKVLVRNAIARQGILRDLLHDDDGTEVDFVSTIKLNDGKEHALDCLRAIVEAESSKTTPIRDFKKLRDASQKLGVFVILEGDLGSHHTKIKSTTFRGFVLADRLAPFIVINRNDAKTAQSFTLLHEMVHLLLGDTGISGFDSDTRDEEQFCNDVASEYLLPSAIVARIKISRFETDAILALLEELSADWRVSRTLIAYRLYRLGKIEQQQYRKVAEIYREQWESRHRQRKTEEAFASFSKTRRYSLGKSLISLVERNLADGLLSTTKASTVFGVKPTQVGTILEMQSRA